MPDEIQNDEVLAPQEDVEVAPAPVQEEAVAPEAPEPEAEVEGADIAPVEIEEVAPEEAAPRPGGVAMDSNGGSVAETPFRTQ